MNAFATGSFWQQERVEPSPHHEAIYQQALESLYHKVMKLDSPRSLESFTARIQCSGFNTSTLKGVTARSWSCLTTKSSSLSHTGLQACFPAQMQKSYRFARAFSHRFTWDHPKASQLKLLCVQCPSMSSAREFLSKRLAVSAYPIVGFFFLLLLFIILFCSYFWGIVMLTNAWIISPHHGLPIKIVSIMVVRNMIYPALCFSPQNCK